MAERMLKSFDALKAAPTTEDEDTYAQRKERLAACANLSEAACSQALRSNPDFQNLLAVAVAGLLQACDDCASDVRMNADECLNRMIKNLINSHLGRLQVELYKAIKREDTPARTLRAALSKFADLAHLVKPFKRRVFVTSMLPSIFRIITIHDESLQETLAASMVKICDSLGLFLADADAQQLLAAFLDNLTAASPVIRRCAADAAIAVCAGAPDPHHYMKVLLNSIFLLAPPLDSGGGGGGEGGRGEGQPSDSSHARLGALLGFRKVLVRYQAMPPAPEGEQLLDETTLERLYMLLLQCLGSINHNIVTSSLETMQQLLPMLNPSLVSWMSEPKRITRCVKLLGRLVLGPGKIRVSVKVVALGCLKWLFKMRPATFRLHLDPFVPHEGEEDQQGTRPGCPVSDVLTVCTSSEDPLLRGNLCLLVGTVVRASLITSSSVFGAVPYMNDDGVGGTAAAVAPGAADEPVYGLSHLCNVLVKALGDDAPTVIRSALVGLRACLPAMFRSTAGRLALEITRLVLRLREQSYWLVKTELLGILSELDYVFVGYMEADPRPEPLVAQLVPSPLADPMELHFGARVLQGGALDAVLLLLGDEDHRVRDAAVETLVKFVMRLFYSADWIGQDPLIALVERRAAFLAGRAATENWGTTDKKMGNNATSSGGGSGGGAGGGSGSAAGSVVDGIQHLHVPRANLSRIVSALSAHLHSSQDRHTLMGCYHALNVLSSAATLPASVSMLGGSSSSLANDMWPPPFCVPDVLPLALGHLKVAWMSLDLGVHADILGLVGNLARDAEVYFRPAVSELLTHVLRVLNIIVHVTSNKTPPTPSKGSMRRQERSPRSRAATDAALHTSGDAKNSPNSRGRGRGNAAAVGAEERPAPAGSPRGYFAHLPHYIRLYEVMQGAYKANKITLNTDAPNRFADMIKAALEVLAIVVESEGQTFDKHAAEVLSYLQSVIALEPRAVLLCVHQLMVALFGAGRGRSGSLSGATLAGTTTHENPLIPMGDTDGDRFFERCIGVSRDHLGHMTRSSEQAGANAARGGSGGAAFGITGTTAAAAAAAGIPPKSPATPRRSGVDASVKLHFIKLFEPLVIRAMNQYTTTSRVPLQQQILFLLCRLMVLRVNYSLLDSDHLFFNSILKQLELIKRGHVREAQNLLSYIFQFLILLAQPHNNMNRHLDMARVLQLAAEVLGSKRLRPQQSLPALRPIVHELFVVSLRAPLRSQVDLTIMQDQVIDMLMLVIQPPVLQQMLTLLRALQHDSDRHRRLSRKIVDALLQLLGRREVKIRNPRVLWVLHQLMGAVAPAALRPVVILLRAMFTATGSIATAVPRLTATMTAAESDEETKGVKGSRNGGDRASWLPVLLVLLKVLARSPEAALLDGLEDLMQANKSPAAAAADASRAQRPDTAAVFVRFLFDALAEVTNGMTATAGESSEFEHQQLAQLLQFIFVLLARSDAVRLAAAARQQAAGLAECMSASMQRFVYARPLIVIYWCQLLIMLEVDGSMWRRLCSLDMPDEGLLSCGQDIARRGAFLLHCEFLAQQAGVENPVANAVDATSASTDADLLSFAAPDSSRSFSSADATDTSVAALDIVCAQEVSWFHLWFELCDESPVRRLFAAAAANQSGHARLIARMKTALETVSVERRERASFITKLLHVLGTAPPSTSLLHLLLGFLATRHLSARRLCDQIAADKLREWASSLAGGLSRERSSPTEKGPIDDLYTAFCTCAPNPQTCPRLVELFAEFGCQTFNAQSATMEELVGTSPDVWHLQFVSTCCRRSHRSARSDHAVCELLRHLQANALVSVIHADDFDLILLLPCMRTLRREVEDSVKALNSSSSAATSSSTTSSGAGIIDLLTGLSDIGATTGVVSAVNEPPAPTETVEEEAEAGGEETEASTLRRRMAQSTLSLVAVCSWLLATLSEVTSGERACDWGERMALMTAVVEYLHLTDGRIPVPPLSAEHIDLFQEFSTSTFALLTDRSLGPGHLIPAHLSVLLDFIGELFSRPIVASSLEHGNATARSLVAAIHMLSATFRSLRIDTLAPSPGHPTHTGEEGEEVPIGPEDGMDGGAVLPLEARHKLCELVRRLRTDLGEDRLAVMDKGIVAGRLGDDRIPVDILRSFRRCAIYLARAVLPEIHAYCLVCNPETGRPSRHTIEFLKELASPAGDMMRRQIMQDEVVIAATVSRICSLGGHADAELLRQVERDFMAVVDPARVDEMQDRDELDRGRVSALRCLTALVTEPLRRSDRRIIHAPRGKELPFLQTTAGQRLLRVRHMLVPAEEEGNNMGCSSSVLRESGTMAGVGEGPYEINVERADSSIFYGHSQLSVAALVTRCTRPVHSPTAATAQDALDAHKVLGLIETWLKPEMPCALAVVNQCLRSLVVIMDTFCKVSAFERTVNTIVGMARSELADDTLLLRFAVPAVCKAFAVVTAVSEASTAATVHADAVARLVELALHSDCASNQLAALHGMLPLLEARADAVVLPMLPALMDDVLRALGDEASSPVYQRTLIAVAVAIMEFYPDEADKQGFNARAIDATVQLAQLPSCPDAVFAAITTGLERLLLCFTLERTEQFAVATLVRRVMPDSVRSFRGARVLKLLLTCMYSGGDADRPAFLNEASATAAPVAPMDTVSIETMERIAALFNAIRAGGAVEAHVLERVLPPLLDDFLPPRQVMNIVMGEFSSIQQPRPELVATIVHRVFTILQRKGHQAALNEWAVLSVSSFLQRVPRSLAISSLACLFVSVSRDSLIRSLIDVIAYRTELGLPLDRCLFWLPSMHFFLNEDLTDEAKHMFLAVLGSLPNSPFVELATVCSQVLAAHTG